MSDTDKQHPVYDGQFVTYGGRRMLRVIGAEDPDPPETDPPDPDPDPDPDKGSDPVAEAAKWKALARKHEERAEKNADAARKLAELEDGQKTELQKATDKVTAAEGRAADAERKALQIEIAIEKAPEGMSLAQVRKLSKRLAGSTREEFEADADELFADFKPDTGDDPKRKPRERLKPGAVPEAEPEENDPAKLAEAVPRSW